jgi:transcriptional regulator of aromatic amino acid metabolism
LGMVDVPDVLMVQAADDERNRALAAVLELASGPALVLDAKLHIVLATQAAGLEQTRGRGNERLVWHDRCFLAEKTFHVRFSHRWQTHTKHSPKTMATTRKLLECAPREEPSTQQNLQV